MAAMKLAGAEVDHQFSDSFKEMIHEENKEESLDQKMNARMMEQMQTTWEDIEVSDQGLGFDDLSLERYRQDLLEEFNRDKAKYQLMPKGVYTGFKAENEICSDNGIIALMGYPAKPANTKEHDYKAFDLVYIDKKGELVLLNQKEVLDALTYHKDKPRFVPNAIDKGEESAIKELVVAMQAWLNNQAVDIEEQEDGSSKKVMGTEAKDVLAKLRRGSKDAIKRIKENKKVDEKYQLDNFDLITWFLVTV